MLNIFIFIEIRGRTAFGEESYFRIACGDNAVLAAHGIGRGIDSSKHEDDPADVPRLEKEIANLHAEITKLKSAE